MQWRPTIEFQMTSTLRRRGTAFLTERRIVLYPSGQTIGTLVHEVAHFIAYSLGAAHHDRTFQNVHVWLLLQVQREPDRFLQHSVLLPNIPYRPRARATQLAFL